MWPKTLRVLALAAVVAVGGACGATADDEAPVETGEGADTPEQAVDLLVEALNEGDFTGAIPLAIPGHAALASLAEGATFGEVADALRNQDTAVAMNFWGGFAQGSGRFLTGEVEASLTEEATKDGVVFHVVDVLAESDDAREMIVREADGFRVDLFASFAPGLADRMVGPVERLLATQTDDAQLILTELRGVVPSLLVAAERPGQPPDVVQAVLRLVELITRVG